MDRLLVLPRHLLGNGDFLQEISDPVAVGRIRRDDPGCCIAALEDPDSSLATHLNGVASLRVGEDRKELAVFNIEDARRSAQGALARVAATPFGEMPIDNFIGIIWIDPMTHAWDVADATGTDHGIDDESAAAAMAVLQPLSDNLRGPGMFNETADASGSDAVSTYIAFTGRKPVNG